MASMNETRTVGGSPFGRIPSLTAQIKELIHDYPEGIGIIKEIAQNADDAGARVLEIIIDRRTHGITTLPVAGMSALQGPSLLFFNDSVFTDDDFDRIQEIYRSGKIRAADKTGQFGKGFNTVYNVTDWPSFITGDRVAIFDPHCSIVPGADRVHPGRYWTLAECWEQFPDLIRPFCAAGLKDGQTIFEGTIFRLPFRTDAQALLSEISRYPFGEENLHGLIVELTAVKESLLLFLKRLEKIRLREVLTSGEELQHLVIETSNIGAVREKREELLDFLRGDALSVVERLETDSPVMFSYVHEFRTTFPRREIERTVIEDTAWRVLHCLNVDADGEIAEAVDAMSSSDVKAVPLGGAAARIRPAGSTCDAVIGKVYCSLPLPIETGLPVHLNGFFDLDSSRHALTTESGLTGSAKIRARWNQLLVQHVVSLAFAHLIDHLTEDFEDDAEGFYAHWPLPDHRAVKPLDTIVEGVYTALAPLCVIRVCSEDVWLPISKVLLVPTDWRDLEEPLTIDGLPLPSPRLGEGLVEGFRMTGVEVSVVSPDFISDRLRQETPIAPPGIQLGHAPRKCLQKRKWLQTILRFVLSDQPKDLTGLPLALMANGRLRSFVTDPIHPIFAAGPEERKLFDRQPGWFLDPSYTSACGLDAPPVPAGMYWMTPSEVKRCLPALLPEDEEIILNPDGPEAPFPTVSWLTALYHYLLKVMQNGHHWSQEDFRKIPLVPDQSGVLCCPTATNTPLLAQPQEVEDLSQALQALKVPLIDGSSELRDAITAFAKAFSGFVWHLTGPDLVDTLASLNTEDFPENLRDDVHPRLLDFLTQTKWTAEAYRARPERVSELRQLPIFPTTDGRVVDLQSEVFTPGSFEPPSCATSVTFVQTGRADAWIPLLTLCGVAQLSRATFIKRFLLPAFGALESADKLVALGWLRDNLDKSLSELEEKGESTDGLQSLVCAAPLICCEDGEFRPASKVHDPDSELLKDLFGDSVCYPDRNFYARSWERWSEFFRELGLIQTPSAQDLLGYVDKLTASASARLSRGLVGQIVKVFEHIEQNWTALSCQEIDDQFFADLASALRGRAWLPAEATSRGLRRWPAAAKPESRLFRPDELFLPVDGNLVASQRPIFARTRVKAEVQRALGFLTTVPLEIALQHFNSLLALWHSGSRPPGDLFEAALQDVYRYLSNYEDNSEAAEISDQYAAVECLWYRGRLWSPKHAFRANVPYFGNRRVAVHIKDRLVRTAYHLLGMRKAPSLDDYLSYLDELVEEFGTTPLPQEEIIRLMEVYRWIGEKIHQDDSSDQSFPLLTEDGILVDPQDVFYDDAPWFRERIQYPHMRYLYRHIPVTITQRPWVRSLVAEVIERPTGDRSPVKNPEVISGVSALQELIRTPEFRHGVTRLVYHEHRKHTSSISAWLSHTSVVASRDLTSELVLTLEGDDVVVGSGKADYFLDMDQNCIFLDGQAGKLTRKFLGEAVNSGLSEYRLTNLSPLESILDCESAEIGQTLTRLRIRPLDDDIAFVRPESSEWSNDHEVEDEAGDTNQSDPSVEHGDAVGDESVVDEEFNQESSDKQNVDHLPADHQPPGSPSANSRRTGDVSFPENGATTASTSSGSGPRAKENSVNRTRSRESAAANDRLPLTSPSATNPSGPECTSGEGKTATALDVVSDRHGSRSPASSVSRQTGTVSTNDEVKMRPRRGRSRRRQRSARRDRIVTYVSFGAAGEPKDSTADLSEDERMERILLGDCAAELVCNFEREHSRSPVKLSQTHPGWDIDSFDVRQIESTSGPETPTRVIEVKGIRGAWSQLGVAISRRQFEAAREYGDRYWLYVVEYADDSDRARIHPIHNPYSKITQFWFDGGWRQLADPVEAPSAACQLVAGQTIMITNVGVGVVERIEERGALRVVHVRFKDGTCVRRPFNPATMNPVADNEGQA